jgi:hypothetical protein
MAILNLLIAKAAEMGPL